MLSYPIVCLIWTQIILPLNKQNKRFNDFLVGCSQCLWRFVRCLSCQLFVYNNLFRVDLSHQRKACYWYCMSLNKPINFDCFVCFLCGNNRIISGYPALNWYLNSARMLAITAMIAEHLGSTLTDYIGAMTDYRDWPIAPPMYSTELCIVVVHITLCPMRYQTLLVADYTWVENRTVNVRFNWDHFLKPPDQV